MVSAPQQSYISHRLAVLERDTVAESQDMFRIGGLDSGLERLEMMFLLRYTPCSSRLEALP